MASGLCRNRIGRIISKNIKGIHVWVAPLVWGLEQWVGCGGHIPRLREGRMSGPPRARGRRGFGGFGVWDLRWRFRFYAAIPGLAGIHV